MACKDFEELILRDLDGEVAQNDKARLQDHLGACATCRTEQSTFTRIDESLRRVSAPATPRRDFASAAIQKAEQSQVMAPRRIRRRVSGSVWATLGIASILLILGAIGGLVWFGSQPVKISGEGGILPPVTIRLEDIRPPERKEEIVVPKKKELTYEELKQIYPFGQKEPYNEIAIVSLELAETESLPRRVRCLNRLFEAYLDGCTEACARGDVEAAAEFTEAIRILVQEGLVPILEAARKQTFEPAQELSALGDSINDKYTKLVAFAREMPMDRKSEIQKVLGFCAEGRDAARAAAQRLGVP